METFWNNFFIKCLLIRFLVYASLFGWISSISLVFMFFFSNYTLAVNAIKLKLTIKDFHGPLDPRSAKKLLFPSTRRRLGPWIVLKNVLTGGLPVVITAGLVAPNQIDGHTVMVKVFDSLSGLCFS